MELSDQVKGPPEARQQTLGGLPEVLIALTSGTTSATTDLDSSFKPSYATTLNATAWRNLRLGGHRGFWTCRSHPAKKAM